MHSLLLLSFLMTRWDTGEARQSRTGWPIRHWLPKMSSPRVNRVLVPVVCSICASHTAVNQGRGLQKKTRTALQPGNVNVSASTRDLQEIWRVTCNHSSWAKILAYSHSMDTYAGLWSQICGSVELLFLEIEGKLTVPTLVLNTGRGGREGTKKKKEKK